MTPEEQAAQIVRSCTGPINVRRYACDELEAEIARAIQAAVLAERERKTSLPDLLMAKEIQRQEVRKIVDAERERAAKICEKKKLWVIGEPYPAEILARNAGLTEAAAAIRGSDA